jgi:hypothetical protein
MTLFSLSLQSEVNRLREQASSLKAENDDLNGQLLKSNIDRAKELANQSKSSLAAELGVDKSCGASIEAMEHVDDGKLSKGYQEKIEKLSQDLLKSKREHDELKIYLDKIIMNVLEKDPTILEVR